MKANIMRNSCESNNSEMSFSTLFTPATKREKIGCVLTSNTQPSILITYRIRIKFYERSLIHTCIALTPSCMLLCIHIVLG